MVLAVTWVVVATVVAAGAAYPAAIHPVMPRVAATLTTPVATRARRAAWVRGRRE